MIYYKDPEMKYLKSSPLTLKADPVFQLRVDTKQGIKAEANHR